MENPNLYINIVTEAAKLGPIVGFMAVAVKYLHDKVKRVEEENKEAREKFEEYLQEDRAKMLEVMQNNTRALEQLKLK